MSTALQVVARKQNTGIVLPNLTGASGEHAAFRFIEFFTVVSISKLNTRAAYGRSAAAFLHLCERAGSHGAQRCAADPCRGRALERENHWSVRPAQR